MIIHLILDFYLYLLHRTHDGWGDDGHKGACLTKIECNVQRKKEGYTYFEIGN